MRRADRLFRLLLELRGGRVRTARRLAEALDVSERTIYRDVADLVASGVPIAGEAGVGYCLRGFDLPPLMFDRDEIEALALGARMVEAWGDGGLAAAARTAVAKIEAAVPRSRADLLGEVPLHVPVFGERTVERLPLSTMRLAIRDRRFLDTRYRDEKGSETERTLRPLGLAFHPPSWLLLAWCELRSDFRTFRVDRFTRVHARDDAFADQPGRTLADYLARLEAEVAQGSRPPGRLAGETSPLST